MEQEHASIRGRRPQYWNVIRRQILQRDGYRCQICGEQKDLSVHHIIPLSMGGDSTTGNLRVLCHTCHQRVHGKRVVRDRTKKRFRIRIRYKPMFVPAVLACEWLWNDHRFYRYEMADEQV
ncbi:HNH endonuclease [Methanospirillum sp.]